MSNSVRPHRWQPTRLPHPWDSPVKNTGVGCHFLLQCMKVKSQSEVAQSCLTPSDPMDCSLPGSSIHGIFQARDLNAQEILHKYEQLILSLSDFSSILNLCPFLFFPLISSLASSSRVCVCFLFFSHLTPIRMC